MLDCLSCLIFANALPSPRMIYYLAYLFVFAQKSISTGYSLRDHFCVLFWGSELLFSNLFSFLSLACELSECIAYVILHQRCWKFIEPVSARLRFLEKCTALQSTWMLGFAGSYSFLSPPVIDVGFVPHMVLPKLPIWKTVHWWMPREGGQILLFWWGDAKWLEWCLSPLLQPSPLSDVVISMLTPTPRLPTAACEEQHSAAQGSHGQVSQRNCLTWPYLGDIVSWTISFLFFSW